MGLRAGRLTSFASGSAVREGLTNCCVYDHAHVSAVEGVSCLQNKLPRGNIQSKMPPDVECEDGVSAAGFVSRSGICTPKWMLVLLL